MVLAHPRLVETEAIHGHDQVEVAFDCQRRVLTDGVKRCHEVSEAHAAIVVWSGPPVVHFGSM
jgi:hypothetical protein